MSEGRRIANVTITMPNRLREEIDEAIEALPFKITRNEFLNRMIDRVLDMDLKQIEQLISKGVKDGN